MRQRHPSEEPERLGEVLPELTARPPLEDLAEVPVPAALRDPPDEAQFEHREFEESAFWRRIPAYAGTAPEEFRDHRFQNRNTVRNLRQLEEVVGGITPARFLEDVRRGLEAAPMSLRISPYILSLIDWGSPLRDPLRIQFIPVASTRRPDHPRLAMDSLGEQEDAPTPGLVHRYPDKALFLALDVCPVYCRYCTRSYAIGHDTARFGKVNLRPVRERWRRAFAYLATRPEVEDVVVSGGDVYQLGPKHLREIGETLLAIPHLRRIRFASKGPAVLPMKLLSHPEWTDTLCDLVDRGRRLQKEVCLHVHFNCTAEITDITREAMQLLFRRNVRVRNQSVLIRGVNDDPVEMVKLVRQLSWMNVQPYYVYQHDMVRGVEELRTRVADAVEIERQVRGSTAGFNTPTFVVDLPGGGGKRDVHSHHHYDEVTGVSVYRSPNVDPERLFLYFDPLHLLPEEGRERWAERGERRHILAEALECAGARAAAVTA